MDLQLGQHFGPGVGDLVVQDRSRYQAGVDHLCYVVIEQIGVGRHHADRRLARLAQLLV
jgi:hypothetical protein